MPSFPAKLGGRAATRWHQCVLVFIASSSWFIVGRCNPVPFTEADDVVLLAFPAPAFGSVS